MLTYNDSLLVGGKTGTKPIISVTEMRKGNNRPFFEPIPNEMLFIPSLKNTVKVFKK